MNKRDHIGKLVVGFAEYYGEALVPSRAFLFVEMLLEAGLTPAEVEKSVKECMRDPSITRMPLPARLIQLARPTLSVEEGAQKLLQRASEAVSKIGQYRPDEAHEYMGDIAWRAIGGRPGFVRFCTAEGDLGTVRAQLRDALRAQVSSTFRGGRIDEMKLIAANEEQKLGSGTVRRISNLVNAKGIP
jgi:hypothetical protein